MRNFNIQRRYANQKIDELGKLTYDEEISIEKSRKEYEINWKIENENAQSIAPKRRFGGIIISGLFLFIFFLSHFNGLILLCSLAGGYYAWHHHKISINGLPHIDISNQLKRQFIGRKQKNHDNYQKGIEGEILVEKELKSKLSNDFVLINDITLKSKNGNIDHLLIGPTGIFIIETKNWSTSHDIEFNHSNLWVVSKYGNPLKNYGNPISQVKNNAEDMFLELKNNGVGYFRLTPVVVFVSLQGNIIGNSNRVEVLKNEDLPSMILSHSYFGQTNIGSQKDSNLKQETWARIVKYFQSNYNFEES